MNRKYNKLAVAALALSTVFGLSACGTGIDSGDGQQVGVISRIGEHGWLCKTTEGEMALLNMRSGSGSSTLDFTVIDENVAKELKKAMEDGRAVEVTWSKRSLSGLCTMESNHLVTAVKEFNRGIERENPKVNLALNGSTLPEAPAKALPQKGTLDLKCVPGANNTLSCAVQ